MWVRSTTSNSAAPAGTVCPGNAETDRISPSSGASTGSREALDRRDGGKRLGGYGVNGAIEAVNGEIAMELQGLNGLDQFKCDARLIALDGTPQKTRLGGNALVATSSAIAWAAASERKIALWQHLRTLAGLDAGAPHIPAPMIQIFGGGRHAGNRKVGKVTWQHDPAIQKICDGWPQGIDSKRARSLGFQTDKDLDEVVRNFIADDLDDQIKLVKAA